MSGRLIDGVRLSSHVSDIAEQIRLDAYPELTAEVERLVSEVRAAARPCAICRTCGIDMLDECRVAVCDAEFTGEKVVAALRQSHVENVVVYLATCGPELDAIDRSGFDPLSEYWLQILKGLALSAVTGELNGYLATVYPGETVRHLHPGIAGGVDWSIDEQRRIFDLLGASHSELLGVRLSDGNIMTPDKSVTGIAFPAAAAGRSL